MATWLTTCNSDMRVNYNPRDSSWNPSLLTWLIEVITERRWKSCPALPNKQAHYMNSSFTLDRINIITNTIPERGEITRNVHRTNMRMKINEIKRRWKEVTIQIIIWLSAEEIVNRWENGTLTVVSSSVSAVVATRLIYVFLMCHEGIGCRSM